MPTNLPPGLILAGITAREDPRDALLVSARHYSGDVRLVGNCPYRSLASLPPGSVVGTSSLRREAVIRRLFPHLTVATIRGNLNTRLRKLDAGAEAVPQVSPSGSEGASSTAADVAAARQALASTADQSLQSDPAAQAATAYDAIVLAAAGVKRMGWAHRIVSFLHPSEQPHAVGQGALGIECRGDDSEVIGLVRALCHVPTLAACTAERAFLNKLQGGCQVPIAVDCVWDWWAATTAGRGCGNDSSEGWWEAKAEVEAAAGGTPLTASDSSAYPSVGTLTLSGTITAVDGSQEVRANASAPFMLPGGVSPKQSGAGGSNSTGSGALTPDAYRDLIAAATSLGAVLASRALAGGAGDILGPLTAPRAATYGAAERPLDR